MMSTGVAHAPLPTSVALRQGVIAAQAREFDRARDLLQQVTSDTPDDVIAWYWLAIASASADAAVSCLRRVLSLDAGHAPAREALSRLLVTEARSAAAAGRRDDARALATEAATLTPDSTQPWRALADFASSQVERIDTLRRLLELSPGDSGLLTQLRQALLARAVMIANSDRVEARARFREAAAINPADLRVWQALCNLADTRDEQLHCLRQLLRVAPDHQQGRSLLRRSLIDDARSLCAYGQKDAAHERWREVVGLNADVEGWLGFADTAADDEEAERAIQSALELDPTDLRAIDALDRLRGPRVDPATLPSPDDAFARFESEPDAAAGAVAGDLDDSALDALALLTVPEPEPEAAPAAVAAEMPAIESAVLEAPIAHAATSIEEAAPTADTAAEAATDLFTAPVETATDLFAAPIEQADELHAAPIEAATEVHAAPIEPAAELLAAPIEAATEPVVNGAVVAAPATAATDNNAPVAETPAAGAAGTVMVVDDSPTIRKILGLTLERAGFRVIAAANGQSALDSLQSVVPGVILLDIAMPDLDGYEVCKRIKLDPRTAGVPVIMLSGKGAFFDKVKGHMAGATEYLTKPFETPAVLAVVTSHCQAEAHHG
jgi:twitching motility two-component system response regulator PilG